MKRALLTTAVVASITLAGGNASAQSLLGAPVTPEANQIARPSDAELAVAPKNRHMITMSTPGDPSIRTGCTLSFDFSNSGQIENVRLVRSSGKSKVDFDCLCAVLGSAPFVPNEKGDRKNITYTFGGRDLGPNDEGIRAEMRQQRADFTKKLNLPLPDYFVVNTIPVSLSYRYPNVFSDSELCGSANLRLIPKTFFSKQNEPTVQMIASNKRFRNFYDRWCDFVSKHDKVTQKEVEKFRDEVDREFSDMFIALPNSISKK